MWIECFLFSERAAKFQRHLVLFHKHCSTEKIRVFHKGYGDRAWNFFEQAMDRSVSGTEHEKAKGDRFYFLRPAMLMLDSVNYIRLFR